MTAPVERVDPLTFPLHGTHLIEASAGTGKTFTIAALYLRLVLGHGGEHAFERPLTPPEILVVTFTDAATKELRDRIRARLSEAATVFLDEPVAKPDDLLRALRDSYPPDQWPVCARALQLAAEWMDEAAVSTIHGWCYRMLREHAFDSDSLFTQTLEADLSELRAEAVRDHWRTWFYPLDSAAAQRVLQWWASPEDLEQAVGRLLGHVDDLPEGEDDAPADVLRRAAEAFAEELAAMKAPWAAWADELEGLIEAAVAAKQVNGTKLKRNHYAAWFEKLRTWAADPAAVTLSIGKGFERLTPNGLAECWKSGTPPEHPALDAMVGMAERLEELEKWSEVRLALLRHAARWVSQRMAAEQERHALLGFDDLLHRLHAALHGSNGARLAELIRRQFPVALIDEFQDTDPVQYGIFNAVYRVAEPAAGTALVLIGDPKQAIYAFRGADIHTYLAARRDTTGRHHTLDTNFRSTHEMVAAVNHCFARAEDTPGSHGAFLFREGADNPLPFLPVRARGRATRLVVDGQAAPALTCWVLPGDSASRGPATRQMAAACAAAIVRLLRQARESRTGFEPVVDDGTFQPLRPADIAVLVNTGAEAREVRAALAERGLRSVYLSDSESVYASPLAADLQRWLEACAEPDDHRRLRAALASACLGLDWAELDRLGHDELAWEERVLQFRRLRDLWRRRGVLPMLRTLLGQFAVPRRLLAREDERGLTDLLHLAELLQQASGLLDGEHALIRHLAEQRAESARAQDARRQRLESDADLVQVVTVHKSKGLEYPLVFLPFAQAARPVKADDVPLAWHDDAGHRHLALEADDEIVARADRERLGEDLRKLYVALTRARHATWIGLAPTDALAHSAVGHLLGEGQPLDPAQLDEAARALARDCPAIVTLPAPEPDPARLPPGEAPPLPPRARPLYRTPDEPWWVGSYSALRIARAWDTGEDPDAAATPRLADGTAGTDPAADSAAGKVFAERRADRASPALETLPETPSGPAAGMHAFARGTQAGSFLHGLMEWAGREGYAQVAAQPALLREEVARRCQPRGWSAWVDPLADWLQRLLAHPLPLPEAAPVALADLGNGPLAAEGTTGPRYQVELEFWFAARRVDIRRLDALVTAGTLGGAPRPPLIPGRLNGMLKGFIDLVFEHEGRYVVVDHKSNWLGPADDDYTAEALSAAVCQHRYDMQYVLYLVALHRLLAARLPGYDYDRHVGGAAYLFLRGLDGPVAGLHAERPARGLIEAVDALFREAALEVAA